jgi:hypothetical protein
MADDLIFSKLTPAAPTDRVNVPFQTDGASRISFNVQDPVIEQLGTHGERWVTGVSTEVITLALSGVTSDSVANLLPANSIIEAVLARVTTTITGATTWEVGDASAASLVDTSARFISPVSTLTAGTTAVGLNHVHSNGALSPSQPTADKIRITTAGTATAGAIRITVMYRSFVAPTS